MAFFGSISTALFILVVSLPVSASLVQHYNYDFGFVPLQHRQTVGLTFGSDINSLSQSVGSVVASGSTEFTIENDGCSGASIPRGQECFFDIVYYPVTTGAKVAEFYFDWTSVYRNPDTGETSNADGRVYYHIAGRTCELSMSLSMSRPEVAPKLPPAQRQIDLDNETEITIQLSAQQGGVACVRGKTVRFTSEPIEGVESGGHNHFGLRPQGTFKKDATCVTKNSGKCSLKFLAGEVSGYERINANLDLDHLVLAATILTVRVPGLVNVEDVPNAGAGILFDWTGATATHPNNHFFKPDFAPNIIQLVNLISESYEARPGINDMSLRDGGLFDIQDESGAYWVRPHNLHRKGSSVDIDKCMVSNIPSNPNPKCPDGRIKLSKELFNENCIASGGTPIKENGYHCEYNL